MARMLPKPTPSGSVLTESVGSKDFCKSAVQALQQDVKLLQQAVDNLLDAGVKKKTVLILLSHSTGLPQKTIKAVLKGISTLGTTYFEAGSN